MAVTRINEPVRLGSGEFTEFRDYLQKIAGIHLGHNKQYLVATRIRRILIEHEFANLAELTSAIQSATNRAIRQKVIDAMTTNETFWFRDGYPFDFLHRHVLPEFLNSHPDGNIRLWSAACSYGQEPYSISMVLEEFGKNIYRGDALKAEVIATDLSTSVLSMAMRGEYDSLSIARGLTGPRLKNHFDIVGRDAWRIKPRIRARVNFLALNLQNGFAALGKFDVIFCRNVLIYFSEELKMEILRRMRMSLNRNAYLILGASESVTGAHDLFDVVQCESGVVYRAR